MGGQFTPVWGWSICSGNQAKKVGFWGGQLPPVLGGQFGRIFQSTPYDNSPQDFVKLIHI